LGELLWSIEGKKVMKMSILALLVGDFQNKDQGRKSETGGKVRSHILAVLVVLKSVNGHFAPGEEEKFSCRTIRNQRNLQR